MVNNRVIPGRLKTNNQGGVVDVEPEKLYSQDDVDVMLEKQEESNFSKAKEIRKETRVAKKQIRLDKNTVKGLIKQSNRILVSISSHALPIDLFPDTLNVEEGRVTVITRHLLSSEVHSVDVKDISNIFINTSILFSQLVIISKTFEENEIRIRNLLHKEAVHARRIIEGLRTFIHNEIDTSVFSEAELIAKLEELSTTDIVT